MLHSAFLRQRLRSTQFSQHSFSSLTGSLHTMMMLYAKKDWKSVLTIANSSEVLQFIDRTLSKNTPMWPGDKHAIATIFDSAANCEQKSTTRNFIRPFIADGYNKHNLIACVGPDIATRLCYAYSAVNVSSESASITSAIEDTAIAPNLLLLNLKPPQIPEYLLAGHLHTYFLGLGERNFGLLRQALNAALNAAPNGASAKVTTRLLLVQLMAARRGSREGGPSSTLPGQLVAAAVQRVRALHGVRAAAQLLQDVHKSADLLPPGAISSTAYIHMLDTLLGTPSSPPSQFARQEKTIITTSASTGSTKSAPPSRGANHSYHSLLVLLRLASGNSATDVALRGDLLKHLARQDCYQEAVDLAALCVTELRWLGSETLNALLRAEPDPLRCTGSGVVNKLIAAEHRQLIRLLDQAQSVLSAFEAGMLILPSSVRRVLFMGQEATSNSPARDTPRKARTCSSFELVLSAEESLLVRDGVLDFDGLLPPQDLAIGLDASTLSANLLNIERGLATDPTSHRAIVVRKLLDILDTLSEQSELEVTMDVLVHIARLGQRTRSMLVANRAVERALRLSLLPESHPARAINEAIRYSWQIPTPEPQLSETQSRPSQEDRPAGEDENEIEDDEEHYLRSAEEEQSAGGHSDERCVLATSHPTLEEMQMLLAAQFATARQINNLTAMRKCYGDVVDLHVALNEDMARDAANVFLFWGEHSSAQTALEALEFTQGAQGAAQLATELLSSLLAQNRLLDSAKVALTVVRLRKEARRAASVIPEIHNSTQDTLCATLHALLWHRILQSDDPAAAQEFDQGRVSIDEVSALEAIAAVVVDALDLFDGASASEPLRAVELLMLLKHFHQQFPSQAAAVLDSLRAAVAHHPRGGEFLQMIVSSTTARGANTDASAAVFDAPAKLRLTRVRNGRAPFAALSYDEMEMHEDDSSSSSSSGYSPFAAEQRLTGPVAPGAK